MRTQPQLAPPVAANASAPEAARDPRVSPVAGDQLVLPEGKLIQVVSVREDAPRSPRVTYEILGGRRGFGGRGRYAMRLEAWQQKVRAALIEEAVEHAPCRGRTEGRHAA